MYNEGEKMQFKKKSARIGYDRAAQRPAIRASICTGEQVAGFKDIKTGAFKEVMAIRSDRDMKEFLKTYGVSPDEIVKEY